MMATLIDNKKKALVHVAKGQVGMTVRNPADGEMAVKLCREIAEGITNPNKEEEMRDEKSYIPRKTRPDEPG